MVRPLGPPVRGRPPDPLVTARPLAGLEVRPLASMTRPPDPPVRVRLPDPPVRGRLHDPLDLPCRSLPRSWYDKTSPPPTKKERGYVHFLRTGTEERDEQMNAKAVC